MVRARLRAFVARLIALLVFRGPVPVDLGRNRFIFNPRTGRLIPQIAGGAGDGEGEGGSGDGDKDGEGEGGSGDGDKDGEGEGEGGSGDGDKDGDGDGDKTNWKSEARKHERRAKAEKKRADDLAAAQAARDTESQTEHEKEVAKAREEAAAEITSKYETERRAERLELAVTRQATRGVKLEVSEDGKKVEKTIKFADPDDAMAHLERAIKNGSIAGDDIFGEDGKVDQNALSAALADLLQEKPHLRAPANGATAAGRGAGDADAGKGKGSGTKSLEDMTPDEHYKQIHGTR